MNISKETTPHECRLRDITYSAPIMVDVEYMRGDNRLYKRDIPIGENHLFSLILDIFKGNYFY